MCVERFGLVTIIYRFHHQCSHLSLYHTISNIHSSLYSITQSLSLALVTTKSPSPPAYTRHCSLSVLIIQSVHNNHNQYLNSSLCLAYCQSVSQSLSLSITCNFTIHSLSPLKTSTRHHTHYHSSRHGCASGRDSSICRSPSR